jgi:hypothetical protein
MKKGVIWFTYLRTDTVFTAVVINTSIGTVGGEILQGKAGSSVASGVSDPNKSSCAAILTYYKWVASSKHALDLHHRGPQKFPNVDTNIIFN